MVKPKNYKDNNNKSYYCLLYYYCTALCSTFLSSCSVSEGLLFTVCSKSAFQKTAQLGWTAFSCYWKYFTY